ncbi:MAG: hypothetical protein WA006_04910 [Rhodoglobus sp.]
MRRERGPTRLDMIALTSDGARIFMWLFFVTSAALAVWNLGAVRSPWPTLACLVFLAGVTLALTLDSGDRLSLPVTVLTMSFGPIAVTAISWQVIVGGYSQWYFGAGAVALFFVALRGRILLAWVGFVLMATPFAVWGATTETGLWAALGLTARQAAIIVIGTLFALGLKRTSDQIARLAQDTSARATAEAANRAMAAERSERLAALDEFATPLLARLVEDGELSVEEREELAIAEAALRDGLRARTLSVPLVADAARQARRRGVSVTLLDDSTPGALSAHDLERATEATAAALRDAADGQVTARLLPPGRELVATIVVDGSEYERQEVPRDGATQAEGPPA